MTDTVEDNEEYDYTYPLGQAATPLQERMGYWLMSEAVGYDPKAAKSKEEAFLEGVRLCIALRIPYQASEHNKQATEIERQERAAARAQAEQEKAQRKAAREAAAAATPAEAPAEAAATKPASKPAKRTGKPAAAAAASTPATAPAPTRQAPRRQAPRRAPAAAASTTTAEAPF